MQITFFFSNMTKSYLDKTIFLVLINEVDYFIVSLNL
jgi:hypothetical protein